MRTSQVVVLSVVLVGAAQLGCGKKAPAPVPASPYVNELRVQSGADQQGTAGKALGQSVTVKVLDDKGAAMKDKQVRFVPASGAGTTTPVLAATDAQGQVSANWSLGTVAGPQFLNIQVETATGEVLKSTTVGATARADIPSTLAILSGGSQSAVVSGELPAPVVVRVTDRYGNPVAGAKVDFTPASQASPASPLSAVDGRATTTWTLGATEGWQTLNASSGILAPVQARAYAVRAAQTVRVSTGDPNAPTADITLSTCWGCHGSPGLQLANADPLVSVGPPGDLVGSADGRSVGSHRKHLTQGKFAKAMACSSCHLVPTSPSTHRVQEQGMVTFSGLATKSWVQGVEVQPSFDRLAVPPRKPEPMSCSGVYCHGNYRGGNNAVATWGKEKSVDCGFCHELPPAAPTHPTVVAGTKCDMCHAGYGGAQGEAKTSPNFSVNLATHIDGQLDPSVPPTTVVNVPLGDPAGGQGGQVAAIDLGACWTCHGTAFDTRTDADPMASSAPPTDTRGLAETTGRGVGAHQSHLVDGPLALHTECAACHVLEAPPVSNAHKDSARNSVVNFSRRATVGGILNATWNGKNAAADTTCSNTYCHGNFPGGLAGAKPAWTGTFTPGTSSLTCNACHGQGTGTLALSPPHSTAARHPQNPACADCHPGYTQSTVNRPVHVDGIVNKPTGCTACHGELTKQNVLNSSIDSAPGIAGSPTSKDSFGRSATTARGVGTHDAHLNQQRSAKVACSDCHVVPATGDLSHAGPGNATVTFSRIALPASGRPPATWDGATPQGPLTCSSTYCHGNFPRGKSASPTWTSVGPLACDACHDLPPAASHGALPVGQACSSCHPGYGGRIGDPLAAMVVNNPAVHVNGVVEIDYHLPGYKEPNQHGLEALAVGAGAANLFTCETCHVGFGAVNGRVGTGCDECHQAPAVFGPYSTGSYPPHTNWEAECTFCHGGRDNAQSGAPPRNVRTISSSNIAQPTTLTSVGAHTSHGGVGGASGTSLHGLSAATECVACHSAGTGLRDPGHINAATASVQFGPLGTTLNLGIYDAGGSAGDARNPTCSSTYCHGEFVGGKPASVLTWTGSFGPAATALHCNSCHGQGAANPAAPPAFAATTPHPPNSACQDCHRGYTGTSVNLTTHVDGVLQEPSGCTACHGELDPAVKQQPVLSGAPEAAPGFGATPSSKDVRGGTATTRIGVGTHDVHLRPGRSKAVACAGCHVVPASGDVSHASVGAATVSFSGVALTGPVSGAAWDGATSPTTPTCSNIYCHGNFRGGAHAIPTWTAAGQLSCTACHLSPPSAADGHPQNPNCGVCHGTGYAQGAITGNAAATHVDGNTTLVTEVVTCSSCHGNRSLVAVVGADPEVRSSPPTDSRGNNTAASPGVGVHLAHVNQGASGTPLSSPFPCSTCHEAVTDTTHANGISAVRFAGVAITGPIANAGYSAGTCSNTYCHGNFRYGSLAAAPPWTQAGKLNCTSCHGVPPAAGHPSNPACAACHGDGYTNAAVTGGAVNTHVDGRTTMVGGVAVNCTSCHGDASVVVAPGSASKLAAAPPRDTSGATATTTRGVGAHAGHVAPSATSGISSAVSCEVCHPSVTVLQHSNGRKDVAFSGLATTGQAGNAVWNGANNAPDVTCSNTYCHGNFNNGAVLSVSWTSPGPVACGSCHGLPPAGTGNPAHPSLAAGTPCANCHVGYQGAAGDPPSAMRVLDRSRHVNGSVDLSAHAANYKEPSAHGLEALAPATGGTGMAACTTCHIAFGAVAAPRSSCDGCHSTPSLFGPYLTGTFVTGRPDWRTACDFCHGGVDNGTGAPPKDSHVVRGAAVQPTTLATIGAHSSHVGAGAAPLASLHGVAATVACADCHEGTTLLGLDHINDLVGNVAFGPVGPSANGGFYDPGLFGSPTRSPSCSATYCHGEFVGGLRSGSVSWVGTFSVASPVNCNACHGQPLGNAALPPPLVPEARHPQNSACGDCHAGFTRISANLAVHIDGAVDKPTGCTACHGELAATGVLSGANQAAPGFGGTTTSKDSHGETARTARGVGAHQAHLAPTGAKPVLCSACHIVPPNGNVLHADPGLGAVRFAGLALAGSATGLVYNAATDLSCSNTYCHGNFTYGTKVATPIWTSAAPVACNSCHGLPPALPHPQSPNCGTCHGSGYSSAAVTGTAVATHVDGFNNLVAGQVSCDSCHGDPTRVVVLGADPNARAAPPMDSSRRTDPSLQSIGAHLAHVNTDRLAPAIGQPVHCSVCHPVVADANHSDGSVGIQFGELASNYGLVVPVYDRASGTCASTYCHGNFPGGAATTVAWTAAGKLSCTGCHGTPPASLSHDPITPGDVRCYICHDGYSDSISNPAVHINGIVESYINQVTPTVAECATACHGDPTYVVSIVGDPLTAAAPPDTSHRLHLDAGGNGWLGSSRMDCTNCHVVATVPTIEMHPVQAQGKVTMPHMRSSTSGGLEYLGTWNPDWNPVTKTCSSTYCHGAFNGGNYASVQWNAPGTVACGSCHDLPPAFRADGAPHTASTACDDCHPGYTASMTVPDWHLDGRAFTPSNVAQYLFFATDLTSSFPYTEFARSTDSYYVVSGLAAGGVYTVQMSPVSEDADLYTYSDPEMTVIAGGSAAGGLGVEVLTATADGFGQIYVGVDQWAVTNAGGIGTAFLLEVF